MYFDAGRPALHAACSMVSIQRADRLSRNRAACVRSSEEVVTELRWRRRAVSACRDSCLGASALSPPKS